MNCKDIKTLYSKITNFPLSEEIMNSDDYFDWHDHESNCKDCSDWILLQSVLKNGDNPDNYPCIHLAYYSQHICKEHKDPHICPDTIIVKTNSGFGISIKDGGSSSIHISNCPWCGIPID